MGLAAWHLGSGGTNRSFNIGIPRVGSSVAALLGSLELPVGLLGAYLLSVSWLPGTMAGNGAYFRWNLCV